MQQNAKKPVNFFHRFLLLCSLFKVEGTVLVAITAANITFLTRGELHSTQAGTIFRRACYRTQSNVSASVGMVTSCLKSDNVQPSDRGEMKTLPYIGNPV